MPQIDSNVILSFLKAILRKFKVCVVIPLYIAGEAADKLIKWLCALLGKEKTASGHLMYGAHACLVPVRYTTTNIFRHSKTCKKQLAEHEPVFILSNLFREEVDGHNLHHH